MRAHTHTNRKKSIIWCNFFVLPIFFYYCCVLGLKTKQLKSVIFFSRASLFMFMQHFSVGWCMRFLFCFCCRCYSLLFFRFITQIHNFSAFAIFIYFAVRWTGRGRNHSVYISVFCIIIVLSKALTKKSKKSRKYVSHTTLAFVYWNYFY